MLIALPNTFGDAATNMAIDAALLATLPEGIAVFRHYGWIEPAITFGYTQKHEAVQATLDSDRTLCRRLTGGGIVDHRNDWTYAIVLQNHIPAAQTEANKLYASIHQAIQSALTKQSVKSLLARCPRKCSDTPTAHSESASQCFVTPAASDVLLPSGQKIAGAAMKRTREGLLIQGSIDKACLPETFDFKKFQSALIHELSDVLKILPGTVDDLRTLFDSVRIQEERLRFESDDWLKRR
ncbi:MAG: lipoyl protein ligase domain-containing protein [Lentimonas sp.]